MVGSKNRIIITIEKMSCKKVLHAGGEKNRRTASGERVP